MSNWKWTLGRMTWIQLKVMSRHRATSPALNTWLLHMHPSTCKPFLGVWQALQPWHWEAGLSAWHSCVCCAQLVILMHIAQWLTRGICHLSVSTSDRRTQPGPLCVNICAPARPVTANQAPGFHCRVCCCSCGTAPFLIHSSHPGNSLWKPLVNNDKQPFSFYLWHQPCSGKTK